MENQSLAQAFTTQQPNLLPLNFSEPRFEKNPLQHQPLRPFSPPSTFQIKSKSPAPAKIQSQLVSRFHYLMLE